MKICTFVFQTISHYQKHCKDLSWDKVHGSGPWWSVCQVYIQSKFKIECRQHVLHQRLQTKLRSSVRPLFTDGGIVWWTISTIWSNAGNLMLNLRRVSNVSFSTGIQREFQHWKTDHDSTLKTRCQFNVEIPPLIIRWKYYVKKNFQNQSILNTDSK